MLLNKRLALFNAKQKCLKNHVIESNYQEMYCFWICYLFLYTLIDYNLKRKHTGRKLESKAKCTKNLFKMVAKHDALFYIFKGKFPQTPVL